ncbi:MAG: hypothetical protein IPM82_25635 [Saprospiraceae bacterium]|nr:hypothetical protein [Saprospiraceae bacterium]
MGRPCTQEACTSGNILEKISAKTGHTMKNCTSSLISTAGILANKKGHVDGEEMVNRTPKFIILGKPGAGKTTYLKYLCLMMLDNSSSITSAAAHLLTLREWADKKIPLRVLSSNSLILCFPRCTCWRLCYGMANAWCCSMD